eukprot:1845064-Heterocapsa_arctica.AAC.1
MGPRTGKHKVGYVRPGKHQSGKRKRADNEQLVLAMHLFGADFEEHGYTKGCSGCGAAWRK